MHRCSSNQLDTIWKGWFFCLVWFKNKFCIWDDNCYKNGLLPIALTDAQIDILFSEFNNKTVFNLEIDLEQQLIKFDNNSFEFDITPFRKYCLLNGLDEIGLSLLQDEKIKQFEDSYFNKYTWLKTGVHHG